VALAKKLQNHWQFQAQCAYLATVFPKEHVTIIRGLGNLFETSRVYLFSYTVTIGSEARPCPNSSPAASTNAHVEEGRVQNTVSTLSKYSRKSCIKKVVPKVFVSLEETQAHMGGASVTIYEAWETSSKHLEYTFSLTPLQ